MDYVMLGALLGGAVVVNRLIARRAVKMTRERLIEDELVPVTVTSNWLKSPRFAQHVDYVAATKTGRPVVGYALVRGAAVDMRYSGDFDPKNPDTYREEPDPPPDGHW